MKQIFRRAQEQQMHRGLLVISAALVISFFAVIIAKGLILLIAFFVNLFYFQRFSMSEVSQSENTLGWVQIIIPAIGGLIVGLMARLGSKAIRGHGIPEAMETILTKDSRIPKRITFLKPLSSAIAIGSGGPFGAEGPIIATGGALGSLFGQKLPFTADERKILVACGAAAGMSAIFGTPLAAILLAIELLLFEFRPKSFIPVALSCAFATNFRLFFFPNKAFFEMGPLQAPTMSAFLVYMIFAVIVGFAAVILTKLVYWLEDQFDRLPIHWMWWPALAGFAVGVVGLIEPRTLGVGYENITEALNSHLTVRLACSLLLWKSVSWLIALSSGTSGGTLAPLMTMGSCLGLVLGKLILLAYPSIGISVPVMALIGMAAIFAGASRALLASVVFALEATQQPLGVIPLLAGCSIAYLVSILLMDNSIMTEKIIRRGVQVPHEYFPRK